MPLFKMELSAAKYQLCACAAIATDIYGYLFCFMRFSYTTFSGVYICWSDPVPFQVMANSAEKIRLAGNKNVMVCERGTMFGYS